MRAGALLTDLYQLTMLQAYFDEGLAGTAVFELFVRELPRNRNFLMTSGLEQVLGYLEELRFTQEDLDWLSSTGRFNPAFLDQLRSLRFKGDVDAMAEGTIFFPNEPILRVTAPIAQAQWIETRIINLLQFEVLIASKAARCVLAAPGKLLVDFGLRRAHGAEAGLLAARASYLAGFAGTSTVQAGRDFGIPIFGTMAHSYVQAHEREELAFERFACSQPQNVTLLIDTYDTEAAARKVTALAPRLQARNIQIRAVRLDSGDLAELARRVRSILDAAGLTHVQIFCSGNLDEDKIQQLLTAGAPIDGFGVGTRLDTSADAPYLDCAYKLVEYDGRPRRKHSPSKATWPGRKQVFRRYGADGRMQGDVVTTADKPEPGVPLLSPIMRDGRRVGSTTTLTEARERAARALATLPDTLCGLGPASASYPVEISSAIMQLALEADRLIAAASS